MQHFFAIFTIANIVLVVVGLISAIITKQKDLIAFIVISFMINLFLAVFITSTFTIGV